MCTADFDWGGPSQNFGARQGPKNSSIIKFDLVQGEPQKMQKLNEYPTTKSLNYEFIRA